MGKRLIAALAVVLASGALISACGGSGGSKPLTQKEFVSQGNKICEAAAKEREEVSKELATGGAGGSKEAEEIVGKLLAPVQKMTEELAALTPPAKVEKDAGEMVAAFEEGISKIEGEPVGGGTASTFGHADFLADEVGLSSCSV